MFLSWIPFRKVLKIKEYQLNSIQSKELSLRRMFMRCEHNIYPGLSGSVMIENLFCLFVQKIGQESTDKFCLQANHAKFGV